MEYKKRIRIEFRLSQSEMELIKEKSIKYKSMTHFIKTAMKEFSDEHAKAKITAGEKLANYYKEANIQLAHVGGNLNQAIKHCNELAKSGSDISDYYQQNVIPVVNECYNICLKLNNQLDELTDNLII